MKPGGSIANRTGSSLERFIHDTISGEGYVYVENNIFVLYAQEINTVVDGSVKVFTDQLKICKSIYGNPIRCDFMLYNSEKLPPELVIESKWQQSKGSVDEKFPYLERNIREQYPYNTIVVLDGGGYKPSAEKWLRSKVGGNFIGVFNMMEFRTYVNNDGI